MSRVDEYTEGNPTVAPKTPPMRAMGLAAGCGWLVFGVLFGLLAYLSLAIGMTLEPTVLSWIVGALAIGAWLLARPASRAASVASLLGALASAAYLLDAALGPAPGSKSVAVLLLIVVSPTLLLSASSVFAWTRRM